MGWGVRAGIGLALVLASAGDAYAEDPQQPNYDEAAVSAALNQTPGPKPEKPTAGEFNVPPPPPRKKGFVVESQVGVMGFIGELNNVSPPASRFSVQFGFEPLRWLMVFAEGDLGFTSTRYSPPSRGYALYGFGGGARLTTPIFGDHFAFYGQGDVGLMRTSTDVLHTYGFHDAENFNIYFGGLVGFEWYQVNPHYALVISGGVRNTPGLKRAVTGDHALAVLGSAGLRYTF